jgi:hypothetical protein
MKRFILISVLAVLLIAAAGTTPVTAKTITALSADPPALPPPFVGQQYLITGMLTDGTSGAPLAGRLVTVYMLLEGKKWAEIGTNITNENGQYVVNTRQDGADIFTYKAVFAGDKTYRKSSSPPVNVMVNALPRLWPVANIYFFELHNNGWFLAKIACYYSTDQGVTWHESGHTGAIVMDDYDRVALNTLGVPNGAWVKMHVIVVGGKDRTSGTVFEFRQYSNYYPTWTYYIDGTTFNPHLDGPYEGSAAE